MVETYTVTKVRHDLASTALYEITNVSIALWDIIASPFDPQVLETVSRGMLARIQQLSEAVSECIAEPAEQGQDDDTLFRAIECRGRPKTEEARRDGGGDAVSPRVRADVAPGLRAVRMRTSGRDQEVFDAWVGSADAIIAAGLARLDEFPGQPGRPSSKVTYRPAAGKQGMHCWDRAPGYRCITRVGDEFRIDVTASIEEQDRRAEAAHARAHRDREGGLAFTRSARLPARQNHLRLAWSAPNAGAGA